MSFKVRSLFTVNTKDNFNIQSLPDIGLYGEIIVEVKNGRDILNQSYWPELTTMVDYVRNISIEDMPGTVYKYADLCAKKDRDKYVINGDFLLTSHFVTDMTTGVNFIIF